VVGEHFGRRIRGKRVRRSLAHAMRVMAGARRLCGEPLGAMRRGRLGSTGVGCGAQGAMGCGKHGLVGTARCHGEFDAADADGDASPDLEELAADGAAVAPAKSVAGKASRRRLSSRT
jgi:hypothetical protein